MVSGHPVFAKLSTFTENQKVNKILSKAVITYGAIIFKDKIIKYKM